MAVYVDDQAVDLTGADLESVLASAREHLEEAGRVVVEVEVDGRILSAEELDEADGTNVTGAEVRLYTADPRELAVETLEHVRARLGEVQRVQAEAADLLQQDDLTEAMQRLAEAVQAWLQTQQAVSHTAVLLAVDLNELTVDGMPLQALTDELIGKLTELKELIGEEDTVALADALAYEWPQIVQRWDRLITSLIERVRQQEGTDTDT